jgi:hypothetical protein
MSPTDTPPPQPPAEHHRLKTREEARTAIAALLQHAQRRILIFAPQLDAYYFNTAQLAQLIGEYVARHRENHLRLLVEDSHQALQHNPRLASLAHRLPDCLRVRQVSEAHRGLRDMFVVADHDAYVQQLDIERYDGIAGAQAPQDTIQLARRFERMWELSEPPEHAGRVGL